MMVLLEFKRALKKKSFMVMLMVGIVIVLFNMHEMGIFKEVARFDPVFPMSPFSKWIIFNHSGIANLFIIVSPLVSSICFADSYLEDLKSGFIKGIYTRVNKNKYLRTKFLVNFLVGGFSLAIPLVINLIILLLIFPSVKPHFVFTGQVMSTKNIYSNLYYSHPCFYILIYICIHFLFGGAYSSIALSSSVIIKNKFVILIIPFIFGIISYAIAEVTGKIRYAPMTILFNEIYISMGVIMLELLVIIGIAFLIFFIGGSKSEVL